MTDYLLHMLVSILCGFIVGVERQLRGKPVGIRTSILVCLSTMTFMQLTITNPEKAPGDVARVLGQVVTGVGFLGAGVILIQGGLIKGVTSASVVWLLAAVGCAIGMERYQFAVGTCVAGVGILWGVERLESAFLSLRRGVHARDVDSV